MRSTQPCTATGLTGATGTSMPGNTWPCSVRFEGLDLFETFFKIKFCPSKCCTISEQDSAAGEIKKFMLFSLLLFIDLSSLTPPLHILTHTHTHSAHTPDNSFMGFVSEELDETEKRRIKQNKVNNMVVVYGKEASMWKVRAIYHNTHTRAITYFCMYNHSVNPFFYNAL